MFFTIFQARILKDYPAELMLTIIACALVTVLSAIVAMVAERNVNAWKLIPDIELIAICYNVSIIFRTMTRWYIYICENFFNVLIYTRNNPIYYFSCSRHFKNNVHTILNAT